MKTRRYSDERIRFVRTLGWSVPLIAAMAGLSESRIYAILAAREVSA